MGKRQKVNHDDILGDLNLGGGNENVFGSKMDEVVSSQTTSTVKVEVATPLVSVVRNEEKEVVKEQVADVNQGSHGKSGVAVNSNEPPSVEEDLYNRTVGNLQGDRIFSSLRDIREIIVDGLTTTEQKAQQPMYMSSTTFKKMEMIQQVLGYDKNIGEKKAKLPLVQKLIVDFFWLHFKEDIKKRKARGERDAARKDADL